ncbi:glycoside hydrolase family 38 C-terminal domain-containing protein [Bacillus sp. AFS017336]|uniref:glycoside hydrolase family 38 N-terminal domain-containing protein n=1 Tax=Bacillus sp. AFS017336 TaxID=2033489 RepID=UPI000BEFB185|nr:glycoside hydrolase family 38 C-terminal domain-containing protein [Bacillus sp. AFS017336]PEL13570.1 alpha-mannosidase [Bacillus sp. AFS017336]
MKKTKKVHVVAHSHWDHEWYFTIEDSHVLLIQNLDYLIETLENNPKFTSYCFDAQLSVVERYLEIRPQNKERLMKLVKERRLFIGPWYTQTDALLGKTEAVIRNLLYGYKMGEEMGHSMSIGYSPDIFGQHAYFPSFYKEFGMNYSIFQRGVYNDQIEKDLNFKWVAPNGANIKTNNIFFGYGPGKFLSSDPEYVQDRLTPILDRLSEMNSNTDILLLPSGGDQVLVRRKFPEIVEELNNLDTDYEFVLSDYETFMEETWKDESFLNVIEGELLACQKSRIHNTCRSERYDIKRLNYLVENKIVNILEPLAIIAQKSGLEYPQEWLDIIWKKVFDSQAHNGIGASNSDDANHDIVMRLTSAMRITDDLINLLKKQITTAVSNETGENNIVTVFNTNPKTYSGNARVVVFTNEEKFSLLDCDGNNVEFSTLDQELIIGGRKVIVTAQGEKEVEIPNYYRSVLLIKADQIPAMGYSTYIIKTGNETMNLLVTEQSKQIQNEYLQLSIENGYLELFNKEEQTTLVDFISFDNVADAGDSFDFSPLEGDEQIYIDKPELLKVEKSPFIHKMTIKHQIILPQDIEERKEHKYSTKFEIITELELHTGESFLRVRHTIDNNVKDHRVRVLLKSNIQNPEKSYADQGYSLMERSVTNPYLSTWRETGFVEAPVPIYPLENIVAISDENHTFATLVGGIKEYEVLPETGELSLTLFRSNGFLGQDNLLWRPGRASGINNKIVYTPDGQVLKKMEFEYAIYTAQASLQAEKLFDLANKFEVHQEAYQLQQLNTFEERLERFEIPFPVEKLPREQSIFEIDNPAVFMSCCKKAWSDDSIVIRLFNPTESAQPVTINSESLKDKFLTSLAEERVERITDSKIVIQPKDYVTILLK